VSGGAESGYWAGYGWTYAMCPPPFVEVDEVTVASGAYAMVDPDGPFYRLNLSDTGPSRDNRWSSKGLRDVPHMDLVLGALHPRLLLSEIRTFMIAPIIDGRAPHSWLSDGGNPDLVVESARQVRPITPETVDPNPPSAVQDLAAKVVEKALPGVDPRSQFTVTNAMEDGQPIVALTALIHVAPELVDDRVFDALREAFNNQRTVLARIVQNATRPPTPAK